MWPRALTAAKRKEVAHHQDVLFAVWNDKLQLWSTGLFASSTLQRHLKCFQSSTWFGKLWGFLWDPGSDFLRILLKRGWGRGQGRAGSAHGLTIPFCDGVKGLQAPGVLGGCA